MDAALFRLSFKHFESESIKFDKKKSVDLLMDCFMGKREGDEGEFSELVSSRKILLNGTLIKHIQKPNIQTACG